MSKLSDPAVRAAMKVPGWHGDGGGLFLSVTPGGSASWVLRVQKAGKRRDIGLGSKRDVTLAKARENARKVRAQISAGLDPVAERRKAEGIPTFREAAALVYAASRKNRGNAKHDWQWMRSLEMFAFPVIGDVRLNDISQGQVHDVAAAIWLAKPETARRVLQRVVTILDWGFSKQYRDSETPVRTIKKGLGRQPKNDGHHAAMPYDDVPAFMRRLRGKRDVGTSGVGGGDSDGGAERRDTRRDMGGGRPGGGSMDDPGRSDEGREAARRAAIPGRAQGVPTCC